MDLISLIDQDVARNTEFLNKAVNYGALTRVAANELTATVVTLRDMLAALLVDNPARNEPVLAAVVAEINRRGN